MVLSIISAEAVCIFIYIAILGANLGNWQQKDKLTKYYFWMVLALLFGTASDSVSYIFQEATPDNILPYTIEVVSCMITYATEFFSLSFFIGYIITLASQTRLQLNYKDCCFRILHAFGMATLIVVMVSLLPATRSVIMSNAIFPISYTVMEAILISMTAVALIMVRKDISFRYAAVGWSIIIGLALSRTLLYLIDWADFSYVAAACSVLLMHLFIQTEEAKKTQARNSYLMSLSMNDKLSGLYNRTAYEEHIATLTAANMTPDFRHMMIDLNNLKFTNDTMGHEAGDELIQAMGSVLSEVVSTYGHAYRIGGDEFACIINASKAEFDIVLVLLKSKAASYSGQYIKGFSFSLGYADSSDFEGKDFTFEDIRKLSDQRMYEDKQRFYIENAQFDRRRSRSVLL